METEIEQWRIDKIWDSFHWYDKPRTRYDQKKHKIVWLDNVKKKKSRAKPKKKK